MLHQDSAMQWNKIANLKKKVTTSKFFVLNSLDKSHLNSVRTQYVCDKSENTRVCAKWQWNARDWCYWIALPGVQSSNTSLVRFTVISHTPVCSRYTVKYPQWSHRVKFVVIPRFLYNSNIYEILLYNRQLVVITHELIYGVRAAHRQGEIVAERDYQQHDALTCLLSSTCLYNISSSWCSVLALITYI